MPLGGSPSAEPRIPRDVVELAVLTSLDKLAADNCDDFGRPGRVSYSNLVRLACRALGAGDGEPHKEAVAIGRAVRRLYQRRINAGWPGPPVPRGARVTLVWP
jgi:hypothetical protein